MHSPLTTRAFLCVILSLSLLAADVDGFSTKLREFNAKKEVVGSFCDACITAMIGVVYDIVQFEKVLLRQVESRCSRFFNDQALERHCVELISRGVIRVLNRLETRLNPNKICSKFSFCFASGWKSEFLE